MAESFVQAGAGLLDLSAVSLADLRNLDDAVLEDAVGRLALPCGAPSDIAAASGAGARMWQNYAPGR